MGNAVTAIFIVFFPAVTTMLGLRWMRVRSIDRIEVATFLFTGTAMLVTYAVVRADYWQTELFGNMAAMTFVLITAYESRFSWAKIIVASVSLFIAVAFKEPFLLSSLGAVLLLTFPRTYVRNIVVPFLIAGIGFAVLLLLLGAFSDYVNVYMQVMSSHLNHTIWLPMFMRGLPAIPWIILRFTDVAPITLISLGAWSLLFVAITRWQGKGVPRRMAWMPLSAYGILSIFLIAYVQQIAYEQRHLLRTGLMQFASHGREISMQAKILATAAAIALFILGIILVRRILNKKNCSGFVDGIIFCSLLIVGLAGGWSASFFGIVFLAFPATACAGILFFSHAVSCMPEMRWSRRRYGIVVVAVFLVITSVGLAGSFWPHHFVFAVPFYFAILLICTMTWVRSSNTPAHVSSGLLLLPFCVLNVVAMVTMKGIFRDINVRQSEPNERAAGAMDRLLDQCGIDRYMIVSAANDRWIFQYTRHSPLNFYIFKDMNEEMGMSAFLRNETWRRLKSADILIDAPEARKPSPDDAALTTYISSHFTTVPWTCASPFIMPQEYVVYFRKTKR